MRVLALDVIELEMLGLTPGKVGDGNVAAFALLVSGDGDPLKPGLTVEVGWSSLLDDEAPPLAGAPVKDGLGMPLALVADLEGNLVLVESPSAAEDDEIGNSVTASTVSPPSPDVAVRAMCRKRLEMKAEDQLRVSYLLKQI